MGKKTIYYRHWVENGVNIVNDLVDENGTFLSLDEFRRKYNIRTNFLEYGAVINSVKRSCRSILNDDVSNNYNHVPYPIKPFNLDLLLIDN